MELVVLSIHLLVCVCLIGLVLLQRSEGGALGMGGGGGGSLMSGRGAADALARMTSIAGGFFLVTSLGLTVISGAAASSDGRSVFDLIPRQERAAPPAPAPAPVQTETTRPDPTESSAPEAAETQLASLTPAGASAAILPAAPPPAAASERAAPLTGRPATIRPATTVPVSVQRAAPPPVVSQVAPAATRPSPPPLPAAATARSTPALILPNTSGAALDPTQSAAESVEVGNGLEAIRRERAGPDQ